jgi:succinoglycan biosynthesis transport protein ExoP
MDQSKIPAPAPAPADAQLHFLDYWRVIRIRKAIIITVFLITAIIATAVTFILPESYSSTARIQVEQSGNVISTMDNSPTVQSTGFDPYFIQTTFEVMQSEVVLTNVIASLDLNNKWGKKYNNGDTLKTSETMTILKGNMVLNPVKNTKLIAITVYSDDPKEAAVIANAMADSYRDYRIQTQKQMALTALKSFEDDYAKKEQVILTVQSNVDQLRQVLKIVDSPFATSVSPTMDADQMRQLNMQRIDDERLYTKDATQLSELQEIQGKDAKKLRDVLPSIVGDSQLEDLVNKLHEAEQRYAVAIVDYSLTNVVVLRIQSELDRLSQQIDNRVEGSMAGIASKVNSEKAALDIITKEVDDAKSMDLANSAKNQPYYNAKIQLDQLRDQQRLFAAKIDATRIDIQMPKNAMVQLMDPAEPGKTPVKPN